MRTLSLGARNRRRTARGEVGPEFVVAVKVIKTPALVKTLSLRLAHVVQQRGPAQGEVGVGETERELTEGFDRVFQHVQVMKAPLPDITRGGEFGQINV